MPAREGCLCAGWLALCSAGAALYEEHVQVLAAEAAAEKVSGDKLLAAAGCSRPLSQDQCNLHHVIKAGVGWAF